MEWSDPCDVTWLGGNEDSFACAPPMQVGRSWSSAVNDSYILIQVKLK